MDVEQVLQRIGVEYFESGEKRFMIRCPFHDDTNPSCGVWKDSGYFKCFSGSCGAEGSFAELVSEIEGVSVNEAERMVRGDDSIVGIEEQIRRSLEEPEKKELKYFSWKAFKETFPPVKKGSEAWTYLMRRGITWDSVKRFHMRWGGDTGKYRKRVVLPICTVEGKLLAYVGRAIYTNTVPKTRKNRSPHRTFFGLYEWLRDNPMEEKTPFVVVEGEFDAIYLQQFGVPAISNMGTVDPSPEKIKLLRKYASLAVLSYDFDEAGMKSMYGDDGEGKKRPRIGARSKLSRYIPTVSVVLPEGRDPNELTDAEVREIYSEYVD